MRLYGWQKNKWVRMPPDATLDGMGKLLTLDDGTHIYQQKRNADYSLKIISTLPPTLEPYLLYHPLVAQSTKEPVGRRGLKAAKKKKQSSAPPTPSPALDLFAKCVRSCKRPSRSLSHCSAYKCA